MRTLQDGGAEVTLASSGSFALTMLERDRHDVVLSRVGIGDMDGHELCAILKADPALQDVRFVLVAGPDEVSPTATTDGGVDLVLPPAMMGSMIVPLILRLIRVDRVTEPTTRAAATAPEPDQLLPRLRPERQAPPPAEPPRRYMTAVTAAAAAPWSPESAATVPGSAPAAPEHPLALPAIVPPPIVGTTLDPAMALPQMGGPILDPVAPPAAVASPPPLLPPPPALAAAPASASLRPDPAARPAPGVPASAELRTIPNGTFQGSLDVMDLANLTQAIASVGKSGRLILALPQGGGMMLFDTGRVVHAEYRNWVGEEAFGALLSASHEGGPGRFCFLPAPAGQISGMPRTIDTTVDRLLLSSATAIDEKG